MLGSPAGPGGPSQRGLWPLAPAPAPTAPSFTADGFSKCGVYSLFPGGPTFGSALYSHRTIGQFTSGHIQQTSSSPFYHKDSLFSTAGYTFGAPTPPPGSPYSPVPVTQLELLAKGFNSNIIIQQQHQDYPLSPKKLHIQETRCDEKCCNLKAAQKAAVACMCQAESPSSSPSLKKYHQESANNGCSRTNPWSGVNVKKEPGATPCQVAEITTSVSPVVKLEVTSPKSLHDGQSALNSANVNGSMGNIPVGIAVARQRFHQEVVGSPSLPPAGLLTTVTAAAQVKEAARISEIRESTTGMAASTTGGGTGGATLLQCTDDRSAPLASWPMGGTHGSALTTPTLWQYPAPVPMEPMVPLPVPMPPVGFQLVRDPTTGGLLLLPTTGIEPLQQAVVWPSYHQSPSVLLPPLPPPPLQLLSSTSSDYLSSSTTLHQHTQTHSTRLVAVTTDSTKRKIPLPIPATTLIKIETDATTLDQTKTLQAVSTISSNTGTVFTDPNMTPLVTTHVIYQHPTNLILSQPPSEAICRSQATSPACLTPPPEAVPIPEEEPLALLQDASNQTDLTPICSEDDEAATITTTKKNCTDADCASTVTPVPEPKATIEPEQVQEISTQMEEVHSIKEEEVEKRRPDLSGLELLSNSIEEFENGRGHHQVKIEQGTVAKEVDDGFGGLDLLCALAEQRIMEENVEKHKIEKERSQERKKEKRKSKRHEADEPQHKKFRKYSIDECEEKKEDCLCPDTYRSYKSEEEVKKFIASKSQPIGKDDWPCMNEMELDMRMKLADLQRQYREKQKELNKLKPKKHSPEYPKKRKRSTHSERSITPPPLLQQQPPPEKVNNTKEVLKPATLSAVENIKVPKLEAIKQSDRIINDYKNDLLRQQALEESCESSPEKNSSSKKRKVGRPKKLLSPSGYYVTTETIVAKKPKNNFVGYFLAAKEKFQMQSSKLCPNSPPRYLEDTMTISHKTKKNKNNNNIIIEDLKSSKIRPKLKAEPTIKSYDEDDEQWESCPSDEEEEEAINDEEMVAVEEEKPTTEAVVVEDKVAEEPVNEVKALDNRCTLTADLLEVDKLRVLTAMGGLFYAGHLNAVQPPDVYSITLDGERGNKPHIMSREEILRDAIVEIAPKSTQELIVGTRLCAYWSQQYRCLYPGSVAEPGTPDPILDSKFVAVEFDDGDSGRIALEDIRLLPSDYPIIEYDPNPLLSLSKRRRRASTSVSTEERRQPEPAPKPTPDLDVEKENKDINKPDIIDTHTTTHKERKRLKKKKREKLKQKLLNVDKKKKKKHRCTDEFCKHKKHHKKHRKHKKHHHYTEEMINHPTLPVVPEEPEDRFEEETPVSCAVVNSEDEVTMDDIIESTHSKKSKKIRDRQESCESRSKMSAFLPARQLWGWSGKGYKRPKARGRSRKQFFKAIQRGDETITVGDSAVFLSTGRPDRPYIGKIEAMWESTSKMIVKVKWFYHPEETVGCPLNLQYPGALFESPHVDENDVQTISHKCEVLPLDEYTERLGDDPQRYETIYDNNDIYYLAGYYDPTTTTLKMENNIPFSQGEDAKQ